MKEVYTDLEEKDLVTNVIMWGRNKNINDHVKQTLKTLSEAGELADAVAKNDHGAIVDAIGDIEVTLIILKDILGLENSLPLRVAWDEIKNRTGKTINGTFIKD